MNAQTLLKYSFYACAIYFCAMSAAHFAGFKVPILFVYWNVPSNHYQDMIIAFCAFTYALLAFTAARHRVAAPAALIALAGTVLGLSAVNLSADLARMIDGASTRAYWLQTGMIAGLLVWLGTLYFKSAR